ncbi:MAG: DUF294 nucleotidyltransferase-like domain-containing protein [Rubrivivax sp.]|nr:DUF294 nucleotidyltransferase-like domain-containing protein [Rubrivivax sp.]
MPTAQSVRAKTTPSSQLVSGLARQLAAHAPFAQMQPDQLVGLATAATMRYFAPDEPVLTPASGAVTQVMCVMQGGIIGRRGLAESAGNFRYDEGDLFPVGAALARRAVTSHYTAEGDTFCLAIPVETLETLARHSAPLADFLNRRIVQLLDLSRQALQAQMASQTLAQQSFEASLGSLARRQPLCVRPDTLLREALEQMQQQRVGSVLVGDGTGAPLGIVTRHDVLGRITLPQVPLDSPVSDVMSAPVLTLGVEQTVQDAALTMSAHGIRHVPIMDGEKLVSIVSERDLFALQRLSLKQVSSELRYAKDTSALRAAAPQIRALARSLIGQGVQARQLTALISHLNDVLAERLVQLLAQQHGLDMQRACWLAFGSEGRSEQTIATDQDNGLVLADDTTADERQRWLAMALDANEALDACGYPLCKGKVMASNPDCCLTQHEWLARFDHWMQHGAPEDLLNASIFFDLRGIAGATGMAGQLRTHIAEHAARLPRFMKQLALNALRSRPPLNWRGSVETRDVDGQAVVDLKLQGTAIIVDAARIYALASGIAATNTRDRLQAYGQAQAIPPSEWQAWVTAFEFLQSLRLRIQMDPETTRPMDNPNCLPVAELNTIDQRVLRDALRIARQLQQRLEMDYQR